MTYAETYTDTDFPKIIYDALGHGGVAVIGLISVLVILVSLV